MIVRAPTKAPAPIVTNGPIATSAPMVASAATTLSGSIPLVGVAGHMNSATACAKAEYGSSACSTAHGGRVPAPLSRPRITADARVVASSDRYFVLATNV